MELPDYITEGDGFVDITLARPAKFDGVERTSLRMREPTVQDQLVSNSSKGDEGQREIAMLANLCEVSPEGVKALTLRNYKRLQRGLVSFID